MPGSLDIGPILRSTRRHKSVFAVVVAQLASAVVVVACLLVIGSYYREVGRRSYGFVFQDLLGVSVREPRVPAAMASDRPHELSRARPREFSMARADHLLQQIAATPGVATVAPLVPPLLAEDGAPTIYAVDGRETRGWTVYSSTQLLDVLRMTVVEGTIEGIIEGVAHARAPTDEVEPVVLTEYLRDRLFPGGRPALGRIVTCDDAPPGRVVAVVKDVLLREPFWEDPKATALRFSHPGSTGDFTYVVRVRSGEHAQVKAALMASLGPGGPVRLVSITDHTVGSPHFQSAADGIVLMFVDVGLTVTLIALIGALAVASFVVAARRRDICIRRAVGATRTDVLRYFLIESTLTAALGTAVGLSLALLLLMAMRRVLPELPIRVWQLVGVAILLWLAATAAALVPARRAARLPPALASREG